MRADLAVALFAAYGSVLAIIVLYQTVMLQNRLNAAEKLRAIRDGHNNPADLEDDDDARRFLIVRALLETALVTGVFAALAAQAFGLAIQVNPNELSQEWLGKPLVGLVLLFVVVSVSYLVAGLRALLW